MNIKEKLLTILWTVLAIVLILANYLSTKYIVGADKVYKVYLDANIIGYLADDNELYDLINKRQKEIKEKYKVDKVYPPANFEIIETKSYNAELSSAEDIYKKMSELNSFTIEGYVITVKPEEKKEFTINVLNREHFEQAINDFVMIFVDKTTFDNYMANTQEKIETTGKIIELMYFDETLLIKPDFISVKDKIYTSKSDLTQYLLFGENYKIDSYVVQSGDTIASISEENKLNPQEFLIANPKYTSEDSLLTIGDKVNITLIKPVLTFSYDVNEVSDTKIPYDTIVKYDNSKPSSYSEITTPGVTGITRITQQYVVKNGEKQAGVNISNQVEIVAKVDQVTTKGRRYYSSGGGITGSYVDTGTSWAWPTNTPYVITSKWGWRWGAFHHAIDISGTGYGSPIYAAYDGTIIASGYGGMMGKDAGYNIVIEHPNGYYTVYAHMVPKSLTVGVGAQVTRGQKIGAMGQSGRAFGTHLHFGLWYGGAPYRGGKSINPCSLWSGRC